MSASDIPDDLYVPKLQSWVWKHAQLSHADPEYVWCCVPGCKQSARKISRKDRTTSNIRHHLKSAHGIQEGTPPAASHNTLEKYSQPSPRPRCSAVFAATLNNLITQFFVSNCLPFNVATTDSYRSLFKFATGESYDPPKRTKLTATADSLYNTMVEVLAADVKDNTISITTDAATLDNGHSYITITAHYITQAMQMRDVTLMVQKMTGSHTGDYVSELLDLTVTAWNAEERCLAVVTDNGANFVRGARLANTVQDELRCACHTLQLALKDGVAGEATLKQLCLDAQHVVVTIRRSQLLTDELHDIQKIEIAAASVDELPGDEEEKSPVRALKLALNVPTRFNSLWILLSRLLQVKSAVQTVCRTRAALFDGKVLTPSQWETMAELLQILTPVRELCDDLETSLRPSVSLLIPLTMQLCQLLGELHPNLKLDSCRAVCDKVRTRVYNRMLRRWTTRSVLSPCYSILAYATV